MNAPLDPGQRAELRAELERRREQIARPGGPMSAPERTVVVHEVLSQDADEPSQREDERAIGQALGGIERAELAEIDAALARIDADGYGLCIDCDNPIPYARLKAEPAALRCVACEARHEQALRRLA
ncbi:MAG TPA: TraR/DksA C4-type zinc finger protein [Rubrivivax sp.]|nr:TraR/DksA C4-type zinc finger protein [Rubrivivax sp.]